MGFATGGRSTERPYRDCVAHSEIAPSPGLPINRRTFGGGEGLGAESQGNVGARNLRRGLCFLFPGSFAIEGEMRDNLQVSGLFEYTGCDRLYPYLLARDWDVKHHAATQSIVWLKSYLLLNNPRPRLFQDSPDSALDIKNSPKFAKFRKK